VCLPSCLSHIRKNASHFSSAGLFGIALGKYTGTSVLESISCRSSVRVGSLHPLVLAFSISHRCSTVFLLFTGIVRLKIPLPNGTVRLLIRCVTMGLSVVAGSLEQLCVGGTQTIVGSAALLSSFDETPCEWQLLLLLSCRRQNF